MNDYATVAEIKELIAKLKRSSVYGKKDLLSSLTTSLEYAKQGIRISKAVGTTFGKASNAVLIGCVDREVDPIDEAE